MKRPRVLVVENDIAMLKLFDSLLAANGYRVTTAVSTAAAARAVDDEDEPFSLALLDFSPGLQAGEVAAALRTHRRFGHAPILGLTTSARPEDIEQVLEAGCDAYLRKPFHLDEFQELLVSLISGAAHARSRGGDEGPPNGGYLCNRRSF